MQNLTKSSRAKYFCKNLFTKLKPVGWIFIALIILQIVADILILNNSSRVSTSRFMSAIDPATTTFYWPGAIACFIMVLITINPYSAKHDISINTDRKTELLVNLSLLTLFIITFALIEFMMPLIYNLVYYMIYGASQRVDIIWFNLNSIDVLMHAAQAFGAMVLFGGGLYAIMQCFSWRFVCGIVGFCLVGLTIALIFVTSNMIFAKLDMSSINTAKLINFAMVIVIIPIEVALSTWLNYNGDKIR